MNTKPKVVFISESIRRDSHAPLKLFSNYEIIHFYLNAPYGDMTDEDLIGSKQVDLENLLDEIVKVKPSIIQGAEPFGSRLSLKLSNIAFKASKKTGAKLVVPILENRPLGERFNLVQRSVLRVFCPAYFRHASAVVILNKGAKRNVLHYDRSAKIKEGIIWGVWGVDTDLFRPSAKKISQSLIYVGRFVEDKGLKYMLEGFKIAVEKIPGLKLKLIGRGDFEQYMRDFLKQNGLLENIEFVGLVKNTALPKYFSESELSIYPSITQKRWEEQVGTVNLQAMACETPALTTKSGAIPEYIEAGVGAYLVNERDSGAIAQAIISYFSMPESEKLKMQKKAREYVMRYDIKEEIAKAEKLFDEILNEK